MFLPAPETSADTSTNSTTMADAGDSELMKQAAVQFFYPDPWSLLAGEDNQRGLRLFANRILDIIKSKPGQYGGFGDPAAARHARTGVIWNFSRMLWKILPHAGPFKTRGNSLPVVFTTDRTLLDLMQQRPASSIPKEFTQQDCVEVGDVLCTVTRHATFT